MKTYFITPLFMFILLWGQFLFSSHPSQSSLSSQKETQIQKIETQIEELEERKRGYEATVIRYEDQATRLQFDDQTYLETRRFNRLAEENRAKADSLEKEINRLRAEKKRLGN